MYLHVFFKNEYYQTIKIGEKDLPLTIGRSEENSLSLPFDDMISRRHARVIRQEKETQIEDCGSKNGIHIDGKKIHKQSLPYEKKIGIGSSFLVFSSEPYKEIKKTLHFDSKIIEKTAKLGKELAGEKILSFLYTLSDRITSCETEDELWKAVFAELKVLFRPDRMIYFETDTARKKAVIRKRADLSLTSSRQGFSRSVTQEIIASGKAVYIRNVIEECQDKTKTISRMGISSLMAVPLFHQKEIKGILQLELFQLSHCFAEQEFFALCILSRMLSGLLKDIKTIERIRTQNECAVENTVRQHPIIGKDIKTRECLEWVKKAAPTHTTVLITGESGTGKECVARMIHALSPRKDKPLIIINCASIPEQIMESELFGHEKGSFTGAIAKRMGKLQAADMGTLFLDEIGEMPFTLQAKLLRFLEEGEIHPIGSNECRLADVRIIAATNKNLSKAIAEKSFREDLFYRISVFQINCPPLRERKGDIIPIALYYLKQFSFLLGKEFNDFSEEARRLLLSHSWPGNIRELKNVIERACIIGEGDILEAAFFSDHLKGDFFSPALNPLLKKHDEIQAHSSLEQREQDYILRILEQTNQNKTRAAQLLGITRKTLYSKLKRWNCA